MTCRNILPEEQVFQNTAVLQDVICTLQDSLVLPTPDKVSIDSWQARFTEANKQNADDLLERQVARKQSEKHESARSIARRLAKNNKHVMRPDNSDDNSDDDNDDDGKRKKKRRRKHKHSRRKDKKKKKKKTKRSSRE